MIYKIDIEEKMILSMFKKIIYTSLQYFKCNLLNNFDLIVLFSLSFISYNFIIIIILC